MDAFSLSSDVQMQSIAATVLVVIVLLSPVGRMLRRLVYRWLGLKARWKKLLCSEVPLYNQLPRDLKSKLQRSTNIFLRENHVKGKNGFKVSEKERVTVAAHACMLLLGWRKYCYNGIREVFIYPSGVPENEGQIRLRLKILGGLWKSDGTIRLSWNDVDYGARIPFDGQNVVFHEFAHELDYLYGFSGGIHKQGSGFFEFLRTGLFRRELKHLRSADHELDQIISDYGTTNQAELFACATEAFFERPVDLKAKHPAMYKRLHKIYRLDPAAW